MLSLTPGPAVLLVIVLPMQQSFQIAFMASLGIVATDAVTFARSALSVGTLILASATLFTILKWIVAADLVYPGADMIRLVARRLRRTTAILI